jgi:GNAT superfamily N-acetyltransferase
MHPMIRPARDNDFNRLVTMGQRFVAESIYGRLFPTLATSSIPVQMMVELCEEQGAIFVAEVDGRVVGMIGLVLVIDHPLTGGKVVEELAWFVEPEHRKGRVGPLLLGAAEAWTTTNGANVLKMVAPWGSDVGRFLERRGYTAVETAYMKRPPFD